MCRPSSWPFSKKLYCSSPQKARAVKIYYFRTAGVFFYLYFHTAVHCFPCIVLKQTNYQRNLAKTSRLLFRFVLKNKLRCFLFNTMCNNQFMQICGKSQSLHHHIRRDQRLCSSKRPLKIFSLLISMHTIVVSRILAISTLGAYQNIKSQPEKYSFNFVRALALITCTANTILSYCWCQF